MFSYLISHSPTVTQKGYKVLIKAHPALSEGAAPPCGIHRHSRPLKRDVIEQNTESKAWLSSNPDVSNKNIKKTKLSLFRGHAVCYLSLQVCVISPRYMVTALELRESYLLGSQ